MTTSNDKPSTPNQTQDTVIPKRVIFKKSTIIKIIVTVIILSGVVVTLKTYLQINHDTRQLIEETTAMKQQQDSDRAQIALMQQTILQTEKNINKRLSLFNKTLEKALQERLYQSNDWIMQKARYYLELATINAHWNNDTQTTIVLLNQASTLLASISNEQLFAVKQAIAKEKAQFLAIRPTDTVGLLSQLDAIEHSLQNLPTKKPVSMLKTKQEASSKTSATWMEKLKSSMRQLDKLVIIRRNDNSIEPLLTPTYEAMLRESIQLNLQETEWAILQTNQTIYELTLKHAIEHFTQIFDDSAPETQAILKELRALQTITLTQPKPTPLESLPLLNQLIDAKTIQSHTAAHGETL